MDKRKEGKPGEARAALRRSVRDNGYAYIPLQQVAQIVSCSPKSFIWCL